MTGNAWLWQVKHCFSFSIEPRAPVSKSGSDFATAALIASLLGTRSSAIGSKTKPGKTQSSATWAKRRTKRQFMAALYLFGKKIQTPRSKIQISSKHPSSNGRHGLGCVVFIITGVLNI